MTLSSLQNTTFVPFVTWHPVNCSLHCLDCPPAHACNVFVQRSSNIFLTISTLYVPFLEHAVNCPFKCALHAHSFLLWKASGLCSWIRKGDIKSLQFIYEDIEYFLMESKYPMLGMFGNKVGLGKQLMLDPQDPKDEGTESVWKFQYMPHACSCGASKKYSQKWRHMHVMITVFLINTSYSNLKSPKHLLITLVEPLTIYGTGYSSLSYNIHGYWLNYHIPLTDYSAQGMSFRPPTNWICHVNPPPTSRFHFCHIIQICFIFFISNSFGRLVI